VTIDERLDAARRHEKRIYDLESLAWQDKSRGAVLFAGSFAMNGKARRGRLVRYPRHLATAECSLSL
jgi:hypothetical protein